MAGSRPPVMLGRADEHQLLDRLLASVRSGHSAVLVIRGDAGVGKTALMHHCARQAAGLHVARIVGVESEMELPFAGLHQLCRPMLDRLSVLPDPQRVALAVALGLSSSTAAPDRFLVALATLSLLAEAATERPLVCLVDDAQWLDAASRQVLGFVARRLLAESVAVVFAVRNPDEGRELAGLPELVLTGLSEQDARALLRTVIPGRLDEAIQKRLLAETRGNPLAIVELARGLAASQLPGLFGVAQDQPLPGRLEESFRQRVEAVPADARRLMLIAAAEPVADAPLVWRAAERLGISPSALGDAESLLAIGHSAAFLHPMVRSVVYRSASAEDRRAVHLALAEVTDGDGDSDRRAWHRATAASEADEDVATELERSAGRAQSRGGLAAAAAFLRRSVALTLEPGRRSERALAAAQASLHAGAFDAALGLLGMAEAGPLDDVQRARVDLLRGDVAFASGLGRDAPPQLLTAARRLEPFDIALARETYLTAWGAAIFAGGPVLLEICQAARALPAPERPLDLLLDGLSLIVTDGHAAATTTLQRAVHALSDMPLDDVLRWGWATRAASALVWDFAQMHRISARQVQLVRDAGALAQLPLYLSQLGLAAVWAGDFADAAVLIAESDDVAAATGSRIAPYTAMRLRSAQGNEAETRSAIANAREHAAAEGQGMAASWAHWASAVLNNGHARYAQAASAAEQACADSLNPFMAMWVLPELVEAAARSGDTERARSALDRLTETTTPSGSDAALGIQARCRALLDGAPEDLHREAIDRLSRTSLRPEHARARLLYGEWLQHEGRRIDARAELRTAHDQLADIGMEAFAERARRELVAGGDKVLPRRADRPDARDELTPQERQIALLARDGLSNPAIGARLFLSPRTVEWHLNKVFAKLRISSRTSLQQALPDEHFVR